MANPLNEYGNVKDVPYSNSTSKDSEIPKSNNGQGNNAGYLQNQHADPFAGKKNTMGKPVVIGR